MPGFRTHVTTSAVLGAGGALAASSAGLPLTTCAIGAGLCTLGGMVPDLDGDTGVPVREIIPLVSTVVPALVYGSMAAAGWDMETVALAMVAAYLGTRFGLGTLFKKATVHRGMWHSIPAALNVGLIALLICSGELLVPRVFKAGMLVVGFLSHLVLDELASIDLARLRLKSSWGTALKLWTTHHWWPNVLTYSLTALLLGAVWRHPVLRDAYAVWREESAARAVAKEAAPPQALIPISGSSVVTGSGTSRPEPEPVQP